MWPWWPCDSVSVAWAGGETRPGAGETPRGRRVCPCWVRSRHGLRMTLGTETRRQRTVRRRCWSGTSGESRGGTPGSSHESSLLCFKFNTKERAIESWGVRSDDMKQALTQRREDYSQIKIWWHFERTLFVLCSVQKLAYSIFKFPSQCIKCTFIFNEL